MTQFIFLVILGYLMGSISSAVIVCRLFNLPDPRVEGSKNPGATNVLRIAGKQYAALVMLFDILKGTIPVLIASYFAENSPVTVAYTVLATVIGHMFPIFFQFRGGKGVATAIGALLGFHFMVGVMVAATWLLIAKLTRYSSLASIIAILLAPFYTLLVINQFNITPPLFFMVILILYKHRNNITRLFDGTESKIQFKHSVIEEVVEPLPPQEESGHEVPATPVTTPIAKEKVLTKKTTKPAVKKVKAVKTEKKPTKATTTAKTSKTTKASKPKTKKPAEAAKTIKKKAPAKPKTKKDKAD